MPRIGLQYMVQPYTVHCPYFRMLFQGLDSAAQWLLLTVYQQLTACLQ